MKPEPERPPAVEGRPTAGNVIVTVPPAFHVPGGEVVPVPAHLLAIRDYPGGQLHCGVLGLAITATVAEVAVEADEIELPEGGRAITAEDSMRALEYYGRVTDLPTVRTRYLVAGFELGAESTPFGAGHEDDHGQPKDNEE
jgi:hypothetical protein